MFVSGGGGSDYVSEQALQNLKHYKYQSVDRSYVSKYILQPYWNYCLTFFPLWMAPNLITLLGFGFVVASLLLVAIFTPDLHSDDAWGGLMVFCAIAMWLYSTFDNIDGKQARRTGSSSPLGELFDHGCDALNCSFGGLVQAGVLSCGHSWYTAGILALTTTAFFFSTWEEYHTGVLYLGYINGPTEGLIIACSAMLFTGFVGPQVWWQPASNLVAWFAGTDVKLVDFVLAGMAALLVFTQIPFSLTFVYQANRAKGVCYAASLLQLVPFLCTLAAAGAWLAAPGSQILHNHMILFGVTTGIMFGRVATKIILSHVTKQGYPYFTVMQVPLFVGAAYAWLPAVAGTGGWSDKSDAEWWYLAAFFVFVTVGYFHWALLVIDRFCTFLGIRCLSLRPVAPLEEAVPLAPVPTDAPRRASRSGSVSRPRATSKSASPRRK